LVYAGRPVGIGVKDVLRAVGPQTAAALITVAIGFAVQRAFLADFSQLARFVVSVPICVVAYLTVVVGVFKLTGPLQLAFSLLHDFSPKRLRRST
jgi:PST family polysaccharide transporter